MELALELAPIEFVLVGSAGTLAFFSTGAFFGFSGAAFFGFSGAALLGLLLELMEDERVTEAPELRDREWPAFLGCSEPLLLLLLTLPSRGNAGSFFRLVKVGEVANGSGENWGCRVYS